MPNPNLPIGGQYNVYQGARYVPIIDGPWSSTKAYEPLVIVTYQGNSYTSRTFVPAGVEPTNETYWAVTGNYNAQVEQYRQEVEALKKQIGKDFITSDTKWLFLACGQPLNENWIDAFIAINDINIINTFKLGGDNYHISAKSNGSDILPALQANNPPFAPNKVVLLMQSYTEERSLLPAKAEALRDYIHQEWPKAIIYIMPYANAQYNLLTASLMAPSIAPYFQISTDAWKELPPGNPTTKAQMLTDFIRTGVVPNTANFSVSITSADSVTFNKTNLTFSAIDPFTYTSEYFNISTTNGWAPVNGVKLGNWTLTSPSGPENFGYYIIASVGYKEAPNIQETKFAAIYFNADKTVTLHMTYPNPDYHVNFLHVYAARKRI